MKINEENIKKFLILTIIMIIVMAIIQLSLMYLINGNRGIIKPKLYLPNKNPHSHNENFTSNFGETVPANTVNLLLNEIIKENSKYSKEEKEIYTIAIKYDNELKLPEDVKKLIVYGKIYKVLAENKNENDIPPISGHILNEKNTGKKAIYSYYKNGFLRIITIEECKEDVKTDENINNNGHKEKEENLTNSEIYTYYLNYVE